MSETQKKTPDFSSFMVRKFDLIYMELQSLNYSGALIAMRDLIMFLDPEIKRTLRDDLDKIKRIIQESKKYGGLNSGSSARAQARSLNELSSIIVYDVLDNTMNAIHEAGYFGWEKYSLQPLARGNRSNVLDEKPGLPFRGKQGVQG